MTYAETTSAASTQCVDLVFPNASYVHVVTRAEHLLALSNQCANTAAIWLEIGVTDDQWPMMQQMCEAADELLALAFLVDPRLLATGMSYVDAMPQFGGYP